MMLSLVDLYKDCRFHLHGLEDMFVNMLRDVKCFYKNKSWYEATKKNILFGGSCFGVVYGHACMLACASLF